MKNLLAAVAAALACFVGTAAFAQAPTPPPPVKGGKMGKTLPPRDAKGRFVKTSPGSPAMAGAKGGKMGGVSKSGKPLPPRDAKGRFMKMTPPGGAPKMAGAKGGAAKGTKMMPPRDAKGRFVKKGATPPSPAPKM